MEIKIFFDDKPVYLCDSLTPEIQEILHHPDAVFVDELSTPAINALLHEIKKPEFHAGVVQHADLAALKKAFWKHFTPIEAAGGIVQNDQHDLLFIERLGKWDLPKGKIDDGESPEEAALREIEEETGVGNLTLKKKVGETYHAYNAYGKHFLKTTHWFYATCAGTPILTPQTEEHITDIAWIPTADIRKPVANTYASIKEILKLYFDTP